MPDADEAFVLGDVGLTRHCLLPNTCRLGLLIAFVLDHLLFSNFQQRSLAGWRAWCSLYAVRSENFCDTTAGKCNTRDSSEGAREREQLAYWLGGSLFTSLCGDKRC